MFKTTIPAPLAFIIIIILVFAVTGAIYWQYSQFSKEIETNNYSTDSYLKEQKETEEIVIQEEERKAETSTMENGGETEEKLIHKEFSYPYPLAWTWREEIRKADFSLTGAYFGERAVPSWISKWNLDASGYKAGERIDTLTLYFKIKTNWEDVGVCLATELRLLLSEEGDLAPPINPRFNTECLYGNRTYFNQEIIFAVPENKKEFTITTGGKTKIFFTVKILDNGDITIDKQINKG
ncbi:MAG: hypothetical protein NTU58_03440 [Candidatus Nealsonbacteria bacterium]|nr:hypothetical protein [Candidatus Nealsonbacteria bacterium]